MAVESLRPELEFGALGSFLSVSLNLSRMYRRAH
jgi:hypothetical protein